MSTAIMYEHNGFHQTFFTVTVVEVIKVLYHSDVEFNHRTLCNTLSNLGKGSLICNMEPVVDHALCCSYTIVCSSCLQNLLKLPVIPAIWRTRHNPKMPGFLKIQIPSCPMSVPVQTFTDTLISFLIISAWLSMTFDESFLWLVFDHTSLRS